MEGVAELEISFNLVGMHARVSAGKQYPVVGCSRELPYFLEV